MPSCFFKAHELSNAKQTYIAITHSLVKSRLSTIQYNFDKKITKSMKNYLACNELRCTFYLHSEKSARIRESNHGSGVCKEH